MLRTAKKLHDFELRARDGVIGKVKDFYFDDAHWTVRYLVVETGSWLNSRKVLIATSALTLADWENSLIDVDLTQDQVRESPGIDTASPVSREQEHGLHEHYGWPAYWAGAGYLGGGFGTVPEAGLMMGSTVPLQPVPIVPAVRMAPDGNPRLRSGKAVVGYHIEATDGAIGHIDDYLVDDLSWTLDYVVIDTRNWLPGRKVVLSSEWISRVQWSDSRVFVDLAREQIQNSPEFDADHPGFDEYAETLHVHYGRSPWKGGLRKR